MYQGVSAIYERYVVLLVASDREYNEIGMSVSYRNMLPEDEDAVFGLRMHTWGAPDIDYVRRNACSDPLYLQHTFVAFAPDGTLLSTAGYWLRHIRDARGTPRRVGCVASVITIEAARRQGHARKLMQLALDSMAGEGCDWSLLFSSGMGVPFYEALGYCLYPAPYYRGTLDIGQQAIAGAAGVTTHTGDYSIARIEAPFDIADRNWQVIRGIYAAYNLRRPLSLLRDEDYWQSYFAPRLSSAPAEDTTYVFLASTGDQPVAYLVARLLSTRPARDFFQEDQGFMIREAAVLPGHDAALPALMPATRDVLVHWRLPALLERQVPGSAFLPREAAVEECMRALFAQALHLSGERRRMMAKPLGEGFTETDLTAAFQAPGALFGHMDLF
jgi:GNAT superfamily N-acetyltransferase